MVEDSGIGIAPELRERVFERFYRVNGDQHNSQIPGCGLGLSIVQHIVAIITEAFNYQTLIFLTVWQLR